ncbi:hypothetical protein [Mesorhizobium sp.]|uniref:hypothetical protein n=1 Tax=Mesorhizobium sp. TaxID=1871066 RepID=UPI000FE632EF|nr:hypothetical protein [Mesorhizobium sp.]RWC28433.1 MAG: hypothetical protein EOS27_18950 [Mesorhizobium sp.]TIX23270.1 MAG: hypothetical protein E5V35_22855 [Mesorhizobium sp.]
MPRFRFETIGFDQTTTVEEELASVDLVSLRAIERAHAALAAGASSGVDHSGSIIRVYDEVGYLVATVKFSDVLGEQPELSPQSSGMATEEPGVMRSG